MPTEPRARAKFEQAASVEYSQFDPIASTIAYEKVFKLYQGQTTNEALVTELVTRLENKLDGYEADLFHLPYGSLVFEQLKLGGLDKRPNLQR